MTDDTSLNPWFAIPIVIACLILSAFFSAGETAFTGASRARMHGLERAGDPRARLVTRLLNMRERFIGAMLIGNNIVNIGVSAFTTSVLVGDVAASGASRAAGVPLAPPARPHSAKVHATRPTSGTPMSGTR